MSDLDREALVDLDGPQMTEAELMAMVRTTAEAVGPPEPVAVPMHYEAPADGGVRLSFGNRSYRLAPETTVALRDALTGMLEEA